MSAHKELRVTKAQLKYWLPRLHWLGDVHFLVLLMTRYQIANSFFIAMTLMQLD
jgi:hypothetical protein